jgi:type I restriction enzyme M protein
MLKSRDVPKELKNFNSLFFEFQYKYNLNQVFDDLLTLIICTLARQTQEKLYFETIERYQKKEIDAFCKLYAELMKIYAKSKADENWCDPLGTYYECLASNYKKSNFGQFFTPPSLCDLMANFTIDTDDFGKQINDPCSGSGRLILAANQIKKGNYFICQDLDSICCKMTAVNLAFHNIKAEVHCMNSLMMDKPRFSIAINNDYWKSNHISVLFYPND